MLRTLMHVLDDWGGTHGVTPSGDKCGSMQLELVPQGQPSLVQCNIMLPVLLSSHWLNNHHCWGRKPLLH
jgi:hypothetical protein